MSEVQKLPAAEEEQAKAIAPHRPPSRQFITVQDPIPMMDTAKFEHMMRIASAMAHASLMPDHLRNENFDMAKANALLVVNQAVRWEQDPFALAQCTFRTPDGKIGFEGKAVHAAIEKKLGIRLRHDHFGEKDTDDRGIRIWFRFPDEDFDRDIDGTVKKWATNDKNGNRKKNWVEQPDDMLLYRGVRQWCRRHAPGIIMGVYTDDELDEMRESHRAASARDITPAESDVNAIANRLADANGSQDAEPPKKLADTVSQEIEALKRAAEDSQEQEAEPEQKVAAENQPEPEKAVEAEPVEDAEIITDEPEANAQPKAQFMPVEGLTDDDRDLLQKYNKHLFSVRKEEGTKFLGKAHLIWKADKFKGLEESSPVLVAAEQIYNGHKMRVQGDLSANDVTDGVMGILGMGEVS